MKVLLDQSRRVQEPDQHTRLLYSGHARKRHTRPAEYYTTFIPEKIWFPKVIYSRPKSQDFLIFYEKVAAFDIRYFTFDK